MGRAQLGHLDDKDNNDNYYNGNNDFNDNNDNDDNDDFNGNSFRFSSTLIFGSDQICDSDRCFSSVQIKLR
jgi:hypothetical protein